MVFHSAPIKDGGPGFWEAGDLLHYSAMRKRAPTLSKVFERGFFIRKMEG